MPEKFLRDFDRLLPGENPADLLMMLRQDALVWDALQTEGVVERLFKQPEGQWNPAGVFSMVSGLPITSLVAGFNGLLVDQVQDAVRMYENHLNNPATPANLEEAGWIALVLHENWKDLDLDQIDKMAFDSWKTVLACLYGYCTDGKKLLSLLISKGRRGVQWVAHIILSNYWQIEKQKMLFLDLLHGKESALVVECLKEIGSLGYNELQKRIAADLLACEEYQVSSSKNVNPRYSPDRIEKTIVNMQSLAVIHQLVGSQNEAVRLLNLSINQLRYWMAWLNLQQSDVALLQDDSTNAQLAANRAMKLAGDETDIRNAALLRINSEQLNLKELKIEELSPLLQIKVGAKYTREGSPQEGLKIIQNAAHRWFEDLSSDKNDSTNKDDVLWGIRTLMGFGLVVEAQNCFEKLYQQKPNDSDLLDIGYQVYEQSGDIKSAIDLLKLLIIMKKDSLDYQRHLAGLFEKNLDWNKAFKQWQAITDKSNHDRNDQLRLVQSAIYAGEPRYAIEICQKLIDVDPDSGLAHTYMGSAHLALGERDEAIQHLSLATLLNPDEPKSWLKLADAYWSHGENEKAIDALKAAIASTNENCDIELLLGQYLAETGKASEALPHLEKANILMPNHPEAQLSYGKALYNLGYLDEAKHIVENGRKLFPSECRLAALEGELFLSEHEFSKALKSWKIAIVSSSASKEWIYGYVESLLGVSNREEADRLAIARTQLNKVFSEDENDFIGKYWLSQLLSQENNHEAAYSILNQISDVPEAEDDHWYLVVKKSLARTARKLGLYETSLTAYRDVLQKTPGESVYEMELAEVELEAGQSQKSLEIAEHIHQLNKKDPVKLHWFGNIAIRCGAGQVGGAALEEAVTIKQDYWDAWLSLCDLEIQRGNTDRCKQVLVKFAGQDKHSDTEWYRAAVLYNELEDYGNAFICIEHLQKQLQSPTVRLLLTGAVLAAKHHNFEKANSYVANAMIKENEAAAIYAFQADLLMGQDRPQAALLALEHALQYSTNPNNLPLDEWELLEPGRAILPENWLIEMANPVSINLKVAQIQLSTANLSGALTSAEEVLKKCPESYVGRLLAVDAALSLNQLERAKQLIEAPDVRSPSLMDGNTIIQNGIFDAYAGLLAIRGELALLDGDIKLARSYVRQGSERVEDCPRLLAVHVRCLVEDGQYEAANRAMELAVPLVEAKIKRLSEQPLTWSEKILLNRYYHTYPVWLGEAFIRLGRWQEGLRLLEAFVEENPNESYAHHIYIRRMIDAAVSNDVYRTLDVHDRMPNGLESAETYKKFEKVVNHLSKRSGIQASHILALGNAAFQPLSHNLRMLESLPLTSTDFPVLASGWRKLGCLDKVQEIASAHREILAIKYQYAIAMADVDLQKSLEVADQIVAVLPGDPLGLALKAYLEEKNGHVDAAIENISTAILNWSDQGSWFAWLAGLYLKAGNIVQAANCWEQAVALQPGNVDYLLGLAETCKNTGKIDRSIEIGSIASKLEPGRFKTWILLGESYLAREDYENGLICAQRAAELDKEAYAPRLLAGEIALKAGNIDQAAHYSQAALMIAPNQSGAVKLMAEIYSIKGQYETALSLIEQSLPLVDDSAGLGVERARLVQKVKGLKEALPLYRKLAQDFPENHEMWSELAKAEAADRNIEAAIMSANRSMKIHSKQPELVTLLGKACLDAGHLDRAIYYLNETIQQNPGQVDAYLDMGKAYLLQRQSANAMKIFEQVMKIDPQDYRSYYQSALVHRESKEYARAEEFLRKASQLAPENVTIRRQLAAVIALNMVYQAQEASS